VTYGGVPDGCADLERAGYVLFAVNVGEEGLIRVVKVTTRNPLS
jgi:hypothetical protein